MRLEEQHARFPTLSRKPLNLYGLHQEMTELLSGDEDKMRAELDLFARYLGHRD